MEYLIEFLKSEKLWVGIFLGLIPFVRSRLIRIRDEKIVLDWLRKNSKDEDGNRFRTTTAICNGVNLTPERVTRACYSSKRIRRNSGDKESWTLFNKESDRTVGIAGIDITGWI